jgi:hydrogenase expression/formation protein HypD
MSLPDNYVDSDVAKHFASLINDAAKTPINIIIQGNDLWKVIADYNLNSLLPETVNLFSEQDFNLYIAEKGFIDKIIALAQTDKTIVTVKKEYLNISGTETTLEEISKNGADIRIVDDILGSMVVASKKRRNKVIFPITGYEDEALITAAGLAKAKTVGFRNFFVLNGHQRSAGIAEFLVKRDNGLNGFIIPLRTGLNTGITPFSNLSLADKKSVVFSGYEPAEIIQSIWMVVSQQIENKPEVVFQRTKEVSDEVIMRSKWMLEEVFEHGSLESERLGNIPDGGLVVKEKYSAFDLKE